MDYYQIDFNDETYEVECDYNIFPGDESYDSPSCQLEIFQVFVKNNDGDYLERFLDLQTKEELTNCIIEDILDNYKQEGGVINDF